MERRIRHYQHNGHTYQAANNTKRPADQEVDDASVVEQDVVIRKPESAKNNAIPIGRSSS